MASHGCRCLVLITNQNNNSKSANTKGEFEVHTKPPYFFLFCVGGKRSKRSKRRRRRRRRRSKARQTNLGGGKWWCLEMHTERSYVAEVKSAKRW